MSDPLTEIRAEFDRLTNPRAPQIQRIARDVYPRVKKMSVADRNRLSTALWASRNHEEGALAATCIAVLPSNAEPASLRSSPAGSIVTSTTGR